MKIGIISDTHSSRFGDYMIPKWVKNAFDGVDIIIHAGDVESSNVLIALREIAPVYAVRGNCDSSEINTPMDISVDIECGLLTVAHKASHARNAIKPETRVLVYGHTHISTISDEGDLLVINPGSPTFPRGGMPPSVAVLVVEKGSFFPRIINK